MGGRAAQIPILARSVRPLPHLTHARGDDRQRRCQGRTLGGHLRQQRRVEAHAILQRVDPAATAGGVDRRDDRGQHTGRERFVAGTGPSHQ
jgi:hypothetical protein